MRGEKARSLSSVNILENLLCEGEERNMAVARGDTGV